MSDTPSASAASEGMPERTFSGLTYVLTRGGRRATCKACGEFMPNANESLYEHAARCPVEGWAGPGV
jgi:hypothetical protein